jgi:streptogramin lyase
MFESFRVEGRQRKQERIRLFLEELEGRCLLSHQITPIGPITTAPDGSVWFLEQDRLGRVDPTTGLIQEYAVGTSTSISFGLNPVAGSIVAAPDGAIWFFSNDQVARFDPGSNSLKKFSVPETLMELSLAIGPDGAAWVGEYRGNNWDLVRINPDTGTMQEYAMGGGGGSKTKIAAGADGRIWATVDFTALGWFSWEVLNPATGAVQKAGAGIPLDSVLAGSDGNIYMVGRGPAFQTMPAGIQILDLNAIGQLLFQSGEGLLTGPAQLDTNGRFWSAAYLMVPGVAGASSSGIADFDPRTEAGELFPLPSGAVSGVASDAHGNVWYTSSNYGPDRSIQSFVGRLDMATGLTQTFDMATELPAAPSSNPPPAEGSTINATAGIDFTTAVATFTPPTPIPMSGTAYRAIVDWGDGSTSSLVLTLTENGTYDVTAGHKYQSAGTYNIKVTIGNYNPSNPLGDNPITVFSVANVDPFEPIFMPMA